MRVLLAEDDPDDLFLMLRAMQRVREELPLQTVENGQEVIDYLSDATNQLPDGIILDLKMPLVDGLEVVRWIRKNPRTEKLTVILLSSSNQLPDIQEAYRAGATAYFQKPSGFEDLVHVARAILWAVEIGSLEDGPAITTLGNSSRVSARRHLVHALLVEDNHADVRAIQSAFSELGMDANLHVVPSAGEAIEYMRGNGPYRDRSRHPLPSLLLLDLLLPDQSGFAVLEWIRSGSPMTCLPVSVITATDEESVLVAVLDRGANLFFGKSRAHGDLAGAIKAMIQFWLMAELPAPEPSAA